MSENDYRAFSRLTLANLALCASFVMVAVELFIIPFDEPLDVVFNREAKLILELSG